METEQELIIDPAYMSNAGELVAAEIDVQVRTAKEYPRSIAAFQAKLLNMVTSSTAVAEMCEYSVPRAGKNITGPSARFAEMLLCTFQNCRAAARIVSIDAKFVTAEGAFMDLENNAGTVRSVKRRITDKYGKTYNDDMIQVTAQAAGSIASRNAILAGVPRALWEEAFQASIVAAQGTKDELPIRRQKMVEAFEREGVAPFRVFQLAGVTSLDEITQQKLKFLRNIFVAIKDGDMTVEQAFGNGEPAKAPGGLDDLASKPIPGREVKDAGHEQGPFSAKLVLEFAAQIVSAETREDMDAIARRINGNGELDGNAQQQLLADAARRRETLPHKAAETAQDATEPEEAPEDLEALPVAHWAQQNAGAAQESVAKEPEPTALADAERAQVVAAYRETIGRTVAKSRFTKVKNQILADDRLLDAETMALVDEIDAREKELGIEKQGSAR